MYSKTSAARACWEDAKDDHLFIFRHVEDYLGDIGRRPFAENFAERREVTGVDQALDFGF